MRPSLITARLRGLPTSTAIGVAVFAWTSTRQIVPDIGLCWLFGSLSVDTNNVPSCANARPNGRENPGIAMIVLAVPSASTARSLPLSKSAT
jgi:hypothetical protein